MEEDLVYAVAHLLSFLTILSCLFLKVPQILYIKEKQSAEGINLEAMLMEMTGFTIMTLYSYLNGYGIMTYMEYPLILAQVYVMFYYVLKYKKDLDLPIVTLVTLFYATSVISFLVNIVQREFLRYLVPFCTPLSGFAKVTYIFGIVKAGNADAVSLTTWVISVLTNLARVFTVYVDSADSKLLANFIISTMLSAGVLVTAMYYQHRAAAAPRGPRRRAGRSGSHND